jgi:HSP20 family molecular chaperone IbpA
MNALQRYHASNLPELMEKISKNSIGLDDYFTNFFSSDFPSTNYPPYNLIQLNNHESKLEIALAGFKENELQVFTEFGKLFVEGRKEESKDDGTFVHKGLAQRSFKRVWTVSDDTKVGSVKFEDGLLTVQLKKIVPEHHARKSYLGGADHETN